MPFTLPQLNCIQPEIIVNTAEIVHIEKSDDCVRREGENQEDQRLFVSLWCYVENSCTTTVTPAIPYQYLVKYHLSHIYDFLL